MKNVQPSIFLNCFDQIKTLRSDSPGSNVVIVQSADGFPSCNADTHATDVNNCITTHYADDVIDDDTQSPFKVTYQASQAEACTLPYGNLNAAAETKSLESKSCGADVENIHAVNDISAIEDITKKFEPDSSRCFVHYDSTSSNCSSSLLIDQEDLEHLVHDTPTRDEDDLSNDDERPISSQSFNIIQSSSWKRSSYNDALNGKSDDNPEIPILDSTPKSNAGINHPESTGVEREVRIFC